MSEMQAKIRRRWLQISLREWFLVVTLFVVALGWWKEHASLHARVARLQAERSAVRIELEAQIKKHQQYEQRLFSEFRKTWKRIDPNSNVNAMWNKVDHAARSPSN